MMNYNNTTWEICVSNYNYEKSIFISGIIWNISGFCCSLIGIPGHILHIMVLSKQSCPKDPTSLYYIVFTICELIFLIGIFWLWCANMSFVKNDPRDVLSCRIFYCILVGSIALSNLYLAAVSIDRSIMILFPFRYRFIVTQSSVTFRIILILLIVIVLFVPHYFYLQYDAKAKLVLCNFTSSINDKQIHFTSIIHSIIFVFIPSLIVCIGSLVLLKNRHQHRRTHKHSSSSTARRMHKSSVLMFLISLWFFVSLLPALIIEIFVIYDQLFFHEMLCSMRQKIYKILLNCFLICSSVNYSTKFYIHLIVSESFRMNLIQFITCSNLSNASRQLRMKVKNNNEQNINLILKKAPEKVIHI
ncbi:unnamed protein product [Rotaria magnacalcarata]|uniref:G-protein coupled receptors family 1 profile domain-containing protein n=1 Tax=Rotaria magnacalcarata TaxID=392030 RepID=A0A819AMR8_9BILA|nr:unnamed protein product [Rotaria magnacalcarata]CAF3784449.1 unnamed protein product [Rotaria magnacalcarata]CAF3863625.1 unnamed protein product [Rotaria magnacalcarata]